MTYQRGLVDSLRQPLWDTAGFIGSADLFVVPFGQGASVFGQGAKGYGDTNMDLGAQLPAGWQFDCRKIEVEPLLDTAPTDLASVAVMLYIGAKRYADLPASQAARIITVEERRAGLMLPTMRAGYRIKSLRISAAQNFSGRIVSRSDRRLVVILWWYLTPEWGW